MKTDCYVLHIYCDSGENCALSVVYAFGDQKAYGYSEEFTGKNRREVIRDAKRAGWIVGKTDYCPDCVKARRK